MECSKGSSLVQCTGDGKGESEDRCSGTDQVAGHKAERSREHFVHYSALFFSLHLIIFIFSFIFNFSFLSQCFWRHVLTMNSTCWQKRCCTWFGTYVNTQESIQPRTCLTHEDFSRLIIFKVRDELILPLKGYDQWDRKKSNQKIKP